ncbi:hypothetical protein [Burkholderia lata]|uniref:hypothetical protein n=1 Tax=Burkholderia lata (strain ATCC 17760 / DSM 23089 / LMG 22485 / NCIMB 9086 / R18194 / 383) TaxID=482957 RepID=UPI00399966B7
MTIVLRIGTRALSARRFDFIELPPPRLVDWSGGAEVAWRALSLSISEFDNANGVPCEASARCHYTSGVCKKTLSC